MQMKLSCYHVATPPFVDQLERRSKRIVFVTRTAQVLIMDEGAWLAIQEGSFDQLSTELRSDLADSELLVPSDEDELSTILGRNNTATRDNDSMLAVIQPTASCQLGCDYCGQAHTAKWLSAQHQEEFITRTDIKLSSGRFRELAVCWFGAEPLSGMAVIRSLTPRFKALAESRECRYVASIVTNGLALTEAIAAELVTQHSVRSINVTLDGVAEFHDARRHEKNGRATFHRIFANLVALARRKDLDVEIKVRTNIDRRNCEAVSPLLRRIANEGIQHRINYYVVPIHSWGNDAQALSLSSQEFAARETEWLCEMSELGFPIKPIPSLKPIVCLAVMPHGELIDATGTLFNCTEVSYVPLYGIPNKFAIGDVSHGETAGRRNLLGDFNERVSRGEYPCSTCRMLPVCGGACPKAWMENHEPCPSAKQNIEARLLLSYALSRTVDLVQSHVEQ
jgi:uncharacterized protein